MRYFLFSLIFHILIVVFALETMENKLKFKQVGNPKISFTMIGASKKINGLSQDLVLKKQVKQSEKKIKKEEKKEVKPKKKKVLKKESSKVREKRKLKKIMKDDKKIIKKIEEPLPKKVVSKSDTIKKDHKNKVVDEAVVEPITETKLQKGINLTDQKSQEKEIRTGFVKLADGSIAAKNQGVKGLSYGFISQPEPRYPEIAKKIGLDKDITIKVRFLIGYNGHVEEIKFYDDIEKFGFRNEVNKALNQWKSTPITVNGDKVKLYFYKKFKFEKR